MTIQEAYEDLFQKAMLIPITTPAEFEEAVRVFGLAVLERCSYEVTGRVLVAGVRAEIEALGRED